MANQKDPSHPLVALAYAGLRGTPHAIHTDVSPCGVCTFLVAVPDAHRMRFPGLRGATHVRVTVWPGGACINLQPCNPSPEALERNAPRHE